jgi:hypothetical protein
MYVKWKLVSVHLEIMLVSLQDRSTVCTEHTIDLEIIFDAQDGTQVTWVKREHGSVHLEIVLISA